jgi:hypothetical protein
MTPTPYILPVEKIYRELRRGQPPQSTPVPVAAEATKIAPTRADANELIQRQRVGTPQELEAILAKARDLRLTEGERNQLGVDLSIVVAQRVRQVNGRRDDPNAQFIAQVLGYAETPYGLIERERIVGLLRDGARNIARCKRHNPPKCECWSAQRVILWQLQSDHAGRSPEGWVAARVYSSLEELEQARSEREPVLCSSYV